MRTLNVILMLVVAMALLFSVGCDFLDSHTGTDVKNGTADPNGGDIGAALKAADGFIPGPWNLLIKLALAGVTLYQSVRLRTTAGQRDAALNAHDSTLTGLKNFAITQGPTIAAQIADAIYDAHHRSDVDPALTKQAVDVLEPPK